MGKCIVIGAGDLTVSEIPVSEDDFCIAVDGGMDYLEFLGIEPDLILGDFDSVTDCMGEAVREIEVACPEKVIRLKPEKDDTDMLSALREGLKRGFRDFRLYGATGGRIDHTLANIQCLSFLKKQGATGYLCDGTGMMFLIQNEAIHFKKDVSGVLSLFSTIKETRGVTIEGMKYELENATITNDFPIGISNEFVGMDATIQVEDGELLCVLWYE